MKYERLTDRETAEMLKNTEGESWDSDLAEAQRYIRLAELEDKIEDGTLIERYFIQEDELPSGKIWYNVCEISETHCYIENQCDTREEAEARLAELLGNA